MGLINRMKNKFAKKETPKINWEQEIEKEYVSSRVNMRKMSDVPPATETAPVPSGIAVKTTRPPASFSGTTGAVSGLVGRGSPAPKPAALTPSVATRKVRTGYRYDEDSGVFTPIFVAAAASDSSLSSSDSSSYSSCSDSSSSSSDGGSCGGSTD